MRVKSLEVKNFGNVRDFKIEFDNQITVFEGREYDSLIAALGLVSLNGIFYGMGAKKISYDKDVYISGTFDFKGEEYRAEYFYCETLKDGNFFVTDNLCGRLYKNGKALCFEDYIDTLQASFDDNEVFWFNNNEKIMYNTSNRIIWDRCWSDISFFADELKRGKSPHNTHYLQMLEKFVKDFKPVLIRDHMGEKTYLQFNENHIFECVSYLENGDARKIEYLSDQDNCLFNFSCFVAVLQFMQGYKQTLNCAKKSVFIFNFLGRIGWDTDAYAVLNQVAELGNNVFVIEPFGVEKHQNGIDKLRFVKLKF